MRVFEPRVRLVSTRDPEEGKATDRFRDPCIQFSRCTKLRLLRYPGGSRCAGDSGQRAAEEPTAPGRRRSQSRAYSGQIRVGLRVAGCRRMGIHVPIRPSTKLTMIGEPSGTRRPARSNRRHRLQLLCCFMSRPCEWLCIAGGNHFTHHLATEIDYWVHAGSALLAHCAN